MGSNIVTHTIRKGSNTVYRQISFNTVTHTIRTGSNQGGRH